MHSQKRNVLFSFIALFLPLVHELPVLVMLCLQGNALLPTQAAWNYTDRYWYIGGQFSKAYDNDGSAVTVNNIAGWDGSRWFSMGIGTNGPVSSIKVDWCKSVYIGGTFTKVDGMNTGPVAMWRPVTRRWDVLGLNGTEWDTSFPSSIRRMDVNCRNIPQDQLACTCDVYVVGKFKLKPVDTNEPVAVNIARYNGRKRAWESLGGVAGHGLDYDGPGEVLSVYCENIGLSIWVMRYLWIGGSFPGAVKRLDITNSRNGWETIEGFPEESKVYGFSIADDQWYMGKISIFGEFFGVKKRDGGYCNNVCEYDRFKDFYGRHENQPEIGLNGRVTALVHTPRDLYVLSGHFTEENGEGANYLAYWPGGTIETVSSSADAYVTEPIDRMAVCGTSIGCTIGSVGFVGSVTGFAAFYNAADDTFNSFGQGVNGMVLEIGTGGLENFHSSSSPPRTKTYYLFIMFSLSLLMYIFTTGIT